MPGGQPHRQAPPRPGQPRAQAEDQGQEGQAQGRMAAVRPRHRQVQD